MLIHDLESIMWSVISTVVSKLTDFSRSQPVTYTQKW